LQRLDLAFFVHRRSCANIRAAPAQHAVGEELGANDEIE
jgi:hypothetical protein